MNVPFVSFRPLEKELKNELTAAFDRVFANSWYIEGTEDAAFERNFAKFCHVNHCIGTGNGLDALMLALKALDIGEGDEVIVPSNTFIATALAVTAFLSIPLHAYAISSITGVLRAGGDVAFSTTLDLAPQWLLCLPLTALCALVLKTGCWPIAIAIQVESVVKVPLCAWRVGGGKWIHDVTRRCDT